MTLRLRRPAKDLIRGTAWIWSDFLDAPNPDLQAGGRGFESHRLHISLALVAPNCRPRASLARQTRPEHLTVPLRPHRERSGLSPTTCESPFVSSP